MPETTEQYATPEALVLQARRDSKYLKSMGKLRPPGLPRFDWWKYKDYSDICNRCIEMANEVCEAKILEAEAEENGEPIDDELLTKIANALYEMLSVSKQSPNNYVSHQTRQDKTSSQAEEKSRRN